MGRLVRDDRKATVTQITTRYNQGMQNTISERTTHRTLKQMGFSSRRPHRVLLLSAKNRKQRLQFAQALHNWTIEDWKNVAWSDESRFLLRHSDGGVRTWRKEHESELASHPHPECWIPDNFQATPENSSLPSSLDFIIKKKLFNFSLFPLTSHCLARIYSEQCLEICITSTPCVCLPFIMYRLLYSSIVSCFG